MNSLKKQVAQYELEVKASTQAFDSIMEEFRLGSKSSYDLDITRKSLLESQGKLVEARHNLLMARVSLAVYQGRFSIKHLRVMVNAYNPESYDPWFAMGTDESPAFVQVEGTPKAPKTLKVPENQRVSDVKKQAKA